MTFKRIAQFVSRSVILVGGLALVGSPAQAYDDSSGSGASCLPFSEEASGSTFHHWVGSFLNNGASTVNVTCPLERDSPNTTPDWAAIYINNPVGKTTTCTFYSNNVANTTIVSETKSTSSSGFRTLYFFNLDAAETWGHYYIFCTLPGGAAIHGWYLLEN